MSSLTPQQEPNPPLRARPAWTTRRRPVSRDYEPIHPRGRWRELGRKLWAPIAGARPPHLQVQDRHLAIFKLKVFATSATMLVSIAAYAWIWGWRFAVGFVFLLLIHELGHVLELRRQGIPASAPLFIPFLGRGRRDEADAAQRLEGGAGRARRADPRQPRRRGRLGRGRGARLGLLVALAFTGFFLNLFNLLPSRRWTAGARSPRSTRRSGRSGSSVLLGLAILCPNPILILVLSSAPWRSGGAGAPGTSRPQAAYYAIQPWQRVVVGVTYLGLAALLVLAMSATHIERTF